MNYNKKTVRDVDVQGKKVLLRCDFNVPLAKDGSGVITDDKRIRAALPTIQYLLDQNAAVIACSHLGKPAATFESYAKKQAEKGKEATEESWKKSLKELSLAPVAKRLSELLGRPVIMAGDVVGPDAQAKAAALKPGEIMLLENTRFEKGETKNDPDLAKAMASMAEVYVSDAFGAVHRAHASTAGVADYLPAVSGFLIQKELEIIGGALKSPKRPLVAILGGSKVSSKIGVVYDRSILNMEGPFMKIACSVTELIGRTPLLELRNYEKDHGLQAMLLAKLECKNPAGSAKDRVAANMIARAEAEGKLAPGATIIEPTSGNTGIGLAAVGAALGYHVILTMPDTMSVERRSLIAAYGAEIVLTPGSEGMAGAVAKAEALHRETPGSIIAGQFDNPANPEAHYRTTGPEIWEDTEGSVDIFVAGVGTGGTISGVGRYLKEQNPNVKIVAVEPASSPLLTQGHAGPHGLQGIGANFVPDNLDRGILDEILTVTDQDAYETGRALARREGILVGLTSGAAVWAAAELARRPENQGKTIVALLPDSGERYLSTPMFQA